MKDFKGILNLNLCTAPILKTFKSKEGGTVEYYELSLKSFIYLIFLS